MKKIFVLGIALAVGFSGGTALAEEADASTYDKIWGYGTFIDNDEAKVIQNLSLSGRLQGDAYSFHNEDTNHEDLTWRRFRFGFKATVFQDFVLHSELDLNLNETDGNWDDFYNRLTDTYIGWYPSKQAKFKIGKQSAGFTLDGATSSKKLIVPERSIVAGNLWFPVEYFTGASAGGDVESWSYKVAGFSASGEPELGSFESGYFVMLSAGHKIGENGVLRFDYVYNDPDYTAVNQDPDYVVGTRDLAHVGAVVYKQQLSERLGLWTDIAGGIGIKDPAAGINQSDLLGIDIMPFYNFTESLQLVLQYAGVTSLENKSDVRIARYPGKNSGAKVETAHNLLLGFNWYLYGHKLKWQNAVEYNYGNNVAGTGEDENGYGLTSAIRISW
jgi:phosphate-selective porin OprO/OprP